MGPQQTRWHPEETAGRDTPGFPGLACPDPAGGRPDEHRGAIPPGAGPAASEDLMTVGNENFYNSQTLTNPCAASHRQT